VRFFLFWCEKEALFPQILNLISTLRMQEMVFAGFQISKIFLGACPEIPLGRAWPAATQLDLSQNATVRLRGYDHNGISGRVDGIVV
jgi:hypothetical protein